MHAKKTYTILLLLMSLIWGLGFPITDLAFKIGFDPSHVIAGRFIIASIVMTILFHRRWHLAKIDYLKYAIPNGIFIFLLYFCQVIGQRYTTSAKTAFITQLVVVIVPFVSILLVREKLTKKILLTALISLAGIYFLSLYGIPLEKVAKGDIIVFFSAVFGAFNSVIAAKSLRIKKFDPFIYTTIMFYVGAILAIIFVMTEGAKIPAISSQNYWPIFFMGVLNTAIGFVIHSLALQKISASFTTVICSSESMWAVLVGVLIGIDVLTKNLIIGGSLVFVATIIASIDKGEHHNA